ncbi:MAG: DUF4168 domain-containing protein [Cyanobacteria bacterium P01_D01_bin.71]
MPAVISERVLAQEPAQAPQTEADQTPESEAITSPTEVSEEQIDQFANAYQALQTIQEDSQAEIVQVIEAEGLTVNEFDAIAQGQQDPAATPAEVSPEQVEQFSAASEQVDEIRTIARTEMEAAIQAEGLSVQEFEQILAMAGQDPALQQEINQRLAESIEEPAVEDPAMEDPAVDPMTESDSESMGEPTEPIEADPQQPEM